MTRLPSLADISLGSKTQGPAASDRPATADVATCNCQESASGAVGTNTIMSPTRGRNASNFNARYVVSPPIATISSAAASTGPKLGQCKDVGSGASGSGLIMPASTLQCG